MYIYIYVLYTVLVVLPITIIVIKANYPANSRGGPPSQAGFVKNKLVWMKAAWSSYFLGVSRIFAQSPRCVLSSDFFLAFIHWIIIMLELAEAQPIIQHHSASYPEAQARYLGCRRCMYTSSGMPMVQLAEKLYPAISEKRKTIFFWSLAVPKHPVWTEKNTWLSHENHGFSLDLLPSF